MLASVYSYHVMVKSVSSCCVHGRRVLSNPVTYDDSVFALLDQHFSTSLLHPYLHLIAWDTTPLFSDT